ncbi:uncharacterized protein LOC17875702 [Capsella rubella]|nr:uncharacterized protein LOC17875702 [Capsella rubella]
MPTTTLPGGSSSPSFNVPHSVRTKKLNGQQKKEEIEKEVWMLREMLDQEEKTREILEQVQKHQLPSSSSSITLPSSLPPKMKELITELSIVEGEISRLEVQISHLQINLKQEQDETLKQATTSSSRRAWQTSESYDDDSISPYQAPILPKLYPKLPPPSPMVNKAMMKSENNNNNNTKVTTSHHQENATFGTKTLHFINKAIKGDYDSFHKSNEKVGIVEKENHRSVHQHENKLQESRNMKKVRTMKSPSPLREPRYASPNKPNKDRVALDTSLDMPPKSLSSTILMEDGQNIQKWHPNKLAENIMKCLNFIYVRLLRTTRVMELEKTGPISRSTNFSSSRSFRVDNATSSLSKSMNLVSYKESRQQDPYGIFDVETSLARDIGPYKNLVIFTSSSMDSKCISSSSSVSLIQKLRVLMNNLETVDLRVLSHQQKLAFWINMFNACIMHGYLQHGVPKTAEKLQSLVYNKATMNVGGKNISAYSIEHCILRKSTTSTMTQDRHEEMIIRKLYGVEATDPNITFALSCGTRSSPAVRIYTGEGVTTELEKSKLEYLQASVVVTATKRISLPELLVKHAADFVVPTANGGGEVEQLGSLAKWVCNQLPTSGSLRKLMVECFKSNTKASSSSPVVEKTPYDFEFQYLLAI